jgi:hypothetical protein
MDVALVFERNLQTYKYMFGYTEIYLSYILITEGFNLFQSQICKMFVRQITYQELSQSFLRPILQMNFD